MQSVAPKKSNFKCPTFAVPSKKAADSSNVGENEETSKDSEDVEKPVTPAGDNAPTAGEKLSSAATPTAATSSSVNGSETSKKEKHAEKKFKKPKFEVKNGVQPNTNLKKDKGDKTEEKKKKQRKPKPEAKSTNDSVPKEKKDPEKKKSVRRKLDNKTDTAKDCQKNDSEKEKLKDSKAEIAEDKDATPSSEENTTTSTEKESSNEVESIEGNSEGDETITDLKPVAEKKSNENVDKKEETAKVKVDESSSNENPEAEKKPKENMNKKEEKASKPKMPVRSLTEEEYEDLFTAAIENAMNLDLDKWEPKISNPKKVREPVKKKYSKTVGKKAETSSAKLCEKEKPALESKMADDEGQAADTSPAKEAETDDEGRSEPGEMSEAEDEIQVEVNQGLGEGDLDDEEQQGEAEQEQHVQESMNAAQEENETTPTPSEHASPPAKKMKPHIVKKKGHLEPKSLPFSETKEKSMIDQIKELKKLKKDLRKEKRDLLKQKKEVKKVQETKKKSSDIIKKDKNPSSKPQQKAKGKKRQMLDREIENDGTWVQCCNSTCMKWRHLPDVSDPAQLPERWTCSMNPCEKYNSCDKEEEEYDECEHIYTKYTEGSVVWAKMIGFPWWPAMMEQDPDSETYFSIDEAESMMPTHYHVVFFDERVSRSWVKSTNVKVYTGDEVVDGALATKMTKKGSQNYNKDIGVAKKNANRALSCDLKTRIELYGFATRYNGPWGKKDIEKTTVSKDAHKLKKSKKRKISEPPVTELLDESTMDDVLSNAEAILDNVEEMLDSLEDSDIDSDFEPDGLVVVEKKKMNNIRENGQSVNKKRKKEAVYSSDSDFEDNEPQEKVPTSLAAGEESKDGTTEKASTEKEDTPVMKFDAEIFTMEMGASDDEEEKEEAAGAQSKAEIPEKNDEIKDTDVKPTKPVEKSSDKKPSCSKDKSNSESSTKEEEPTDCVDIGVKETKSDSLDSNNESGSMKIAEDDAMHDTDNVHTEDTKDDCDKNADIDENEDSDSDEELDLFGGNANNDCEKIFIPDKNEDCDSGDEFDLCDENDAKAKDDCEKNAIPDNNEDSDSDDDFDLCGGDDGEVPQLNEDSEDSASQRTVDVEDDSDSDFDLEERFMYDAAVDGSQKSQERDLPPVPVAIYLEDGSNPFDLMEE